MKLHNIKPSRINIKWHIYILSVLSIVSLFLAIYFKYKDGQSYIQAQIDSTFQYIVNEELDSRFHKFGIPLFIDSDSTTKKKQATEGSLIIRHHSEDQWKQWILYQSHYELHLDSLSHRMKVLYANHRIETECIVCYTNLKTNKTTHSHSLHSPSEMPFHSKPLVLDTKQPLQVQSFLDFSPSTILNEGEWNIYFPVAMITGSLSLLLIGATLIKKSHLTQNETIPLRIDNPETNSESLQFGTLFFNKKTGELKINEQKTHLTRYLGQLLTLLIEAPEQFAKDEEIMSTLWGVTGTKNKLNNLVSRLRKELHDLDPSIDIKKYSGKGYQLVYKTKKEEE